MFLFSLRSSLIALAHPVSCNNPTQGAMAVKHIQAGSTKLIAFGAWLTEDPRRVTVIFTLITVLAAAVALTAGFAHPAILVGPAGEGGSGGG